MSFSNRCHCLIIVIVSSSLSISSIYHPHHQEPILFVLQINENNLEKQEIVDFVKQLCAAIGQLIPGFEVILIIADYIITGFEVILFLLLTISAIDC